MNISPWIVVVALGVLLAGLFVAGRRLCNDYIRGFFVIVGVLEVVYLWIAVFNPDVNVVRGVVRTALLLDTGGALALLYRYLRKRK